MLSCILWASRMSSLSLPFQAARGQLKEEGSQACHRQGVVALPPSLPQILTHFSQVCAHASFIGTYSQVSL